MFIRDEKRLSHPQANDYYDDLDTRNLLFGAGISGTTGTLFQAAEAFGQLQTTELKKQYCAAILGYLVGGGMHSYHEVMAVAEKLEFHINQVPLWSLYQSQYLTMMNLKIYQLNIMMLQS